MKKTLAFALILTLACACAACAPEKKEPETAHNRPGEELIAPNSTENFFVEIQIGECLANATGVCVARFVSASENGDFANFIFAVDTVYRGSFPDGTVTVTVETRFDYVQRYRSLAANERVLLVLEPEDAIPGGAALRPVCECFIPLDRFLINASTGSPFLDSFPFFHDMYAPTEARLLALCAQYAD